MKRLTTHRIGIATIAVAVTLLGLVLAQGMMDGQQNPDFGHGHGMMGHGMMGHGMMGHGMMGHGMMGHGMMGHGMMGHGMMGHGMMGHGMMGHGMMGHGMMAVYPASAQPVTLEEAEARFEQAAAAFGQGVLVRDVMAFSNNYYAQIVDAEGMGVAEVLVDRYTGLVTPEPGPNMMWNTRSGMIAPNPGATSRYDQAAAQDLAEAFLSSYLPGATVEAGQAFPGYFTFDFGRSGIQGMLSVNTFSGEIWVHTWHGTFLGEHES